MNLNVYLKCFAYMNGVPMFNPIIKIIKQNEITICIRILKSLNQKKGKMRLHIFSKLEFLFCEFFVIRKNPKCKVILLKLANFFLTHIFILGNCIKFHAKINK